MAFSTLQWIESGFSQDYLRENITTIEDALAVANQIIADRELVTLGGSEAPLNWAQEVPYRLGSNTTGSLDTVIDEQGGEDVTAGDTIFSWLSGSQQSSKASRYLSNYEQAKEEYSDQIANLKSNIANLQDYPDDISDEEKAKLDAQVQQILDENSGLLDFATTLGIEVPEAVKTATGYIPASEVSSGSTGGIPGHTTPGHTGEYLNIVDNGDGTFDIVGESGKSYETGMTLQDALAKQTELQSGAFPSSPVTVTSGTATNESGINPDTGLPYNIDLSAMTEYQIAYLQKVSELASTNYDLLNSLLGSYRITDEDIAGFLETAKAEVGPYYTQILTRGLEDFTNALEVEAQSRALELESEALQRAQAIRGAQSSLEASGLTFSGEAVRQLGAEGATSEERLGTSIPEGEIPQAYRLLASSTQAQYDQDIRDLTRTAEEYYGSSALTGATIPTLNGQAVTSITPDVKGTLEAEQTTVEETRADELATEEAIRRAMTLSTSSESDEALITAYTNI